MKQPQHQGSEEQDTEISHWITWFYSSIVCLTRFWNFLMLHPLLHEVSQTQMVLSTHGILNQGLFPRVGSTIA